MLSTSSDTAAALLGHGVTTLYEARGRRGLLAGISVLVGSPFAARAMTVSIPAGDNLGIHLALAEAEPGWALCVASRGKGLFGVVGDLLVEVARVRETAGFVIDDCIRDIDALTAPPSIAARGVCARGTIKHRVIAVAEPVAVGGVWIEPGDWVVADSDGVCVVPHAEVESTQRAAEARTEKEQRFREKIAAGSSTVELFGLAATRVLLTGQQEEKEST